MGHGRRVAALLVVFVGAWAARAPAQDYVRASWTIESGLPQNQITALLQTAEGYLWVGTPRGLARFDGVRFANFTSVNTPAFSSDFISVLHQDREGTLWIGTWFGGLVRLESGVFSNVLQADALPGQVVTGLADAREGGIWIATDRGVLRYASGRAQPVLPGTATDVPGYLTPVLEDRDGTLWVGTVRGLIESRPGVSRLYSTADGLPGPSVRTITQDSSGTIWIGTNAGMATRTGDLLAPVPFDGSAPTIYSVVHERDGTVWAGTFDGTLLRARGTEATRYDPAEGVGVGIVRALLVDREGSLWIGTNSDGLVRWRPRLFQTLTQRDGLLSRAVMPIYEDRDGTLWIGTCAGPSAVRDGRIVSYTAKDGLTSSCVRAIHQDRSGRVWMGCSFGLFYLDNGRFAQYTALPQPVSGPVSAFAESPDGRLWVGTATGVLQLAPGGVTRYAQPDGLAHNDVRALLPSRGGGFWVGTMGGLSLIRDGRVTSYTRAAGLPSDVVRTLHEDADGTLWIGTAGGGLARLKAGRFAHVTTANGLLDDVISRILEDEAGDFWMSSGRGIFRTSREDLDAVADGRARFLRSVPYGVADGMPTLETNGGAQPAGWRTRDGRLWFPTMAGAVSIDPKHERNLTPPPVVIERVVVDQQPVEAGLSIDLQPGRHSVELHYTALSFAAPDRVRFRYALEGYDEGWVDAGARRVAYYTGLGPGEYRFRVIASNNDGVWNETGAAMAVVQRPHVYQTMWFLALCLVGAAGTALGGYRLRVRQLVQRTRELEARVAERTAEVVAEKNKLGEANLALGRANEDLLTTLSGLRLGVIIAGPSGAVAFVSSTMQQVLGTTPEEAVGKRWDELLSLDRYDAAEIRRVVELPVGRRVKVPVRLATAAGRRYWMEVEVLDDPRDAARRMFFLYDVSEVYDLRRLLDEKAQFHGLVGRSRSMQLLYKSIADLGAVDSTVLIEGETGTGKELAARAIHYLSRRRNKPFVAVNCAALTESLLASQLFGHRRGAFTGAVSDQVGLFEAAHGGTIFLDEIGDVPASIQVGLLRVLQEREITRLGDAAPRKIDVRVIAATNRSLDREVAEGRFRQDLLYRIRVVRVPLPALRERTDDIPMLVAWFLGQARSATGKAVHDVSHEAMEILMEHPWPGNVRELKSAIESAVIRAAGSVVSPGDLPPEILGPSGAPALAVDAASERQRLEEALARAGGNRSAAAKLLGISRATLYRRLASLESSDAI